MAPIQAAASASVTHAIIPSLWLISALTHAKPPATRHTLLLLALTITLFVHAALQPSHHPSHHAARAPRDRAHPPPVFRQVAAPSVDELPVGPVGATPSPTPSPVASTAPPPLPPPVITPDDDASQTGDAPSLDDCSGGLKRMQVVLLLELCFEFLFLFLRCFADQEDTRDDPIVDVTFRGYVFVRAIYCVPVLAINAGIYWVGGGPTGECLSSFSALQVPFTHLIFYALYCILVVIIGVYRIDEYEDKSSSDGHSTTTPSRHGPPTRTSSYFTYERRARHNSSSTSYDTPRFRLNLPCCNLNF